jgi:TRAP-type C4-dicarboxylate transport system permease small subunit
MVDRAERGAIIILCSLLVVIVALQVMLRFFFRTGLFWGEEAIRLSFVWLVCLGIARAFRHGTHVSVELFVKRLPQRLQAFASLVNSLLCLAVMCAVIYSGLLMTTRNWDLMHVTLPIPLGVLYLGFPVAGVLSIGPLAVEMVGSWRNLTHPGKKEPADLDTNNDSPGRDTGATPSA